MGGVTIFAIPGDFLLMDQKPILTIVAGVNGAGKSTYMNQLKENSNILIHNPDSIRKKETKKNPGIGNLSIGRAIIKDRNQKLSLKQNMAWETTLSGATMIDHIKKAKKDGFQVNLVFVSLDKLNTHFKRIKERVLTGGHDIPAHDVKRRFRTSYENFKKVIPQVDNLKIYDNTRHFEKVLEGQNGKVKFAGQLNEKLQEIFPGLQKIRSQKPQKLSAVEQLKQNRKKQAQNKGLSR